MIKPASTMVITGQRYVVIAHNQDRPAMGSAALPDDFWTYFQSRTH